MYHVYEIQVICGKHTKKFFLALIKYVLFTGLCSHFALLLCYCVGVEVLQLYANDPDSEANARMTFSLVGQSSLFQVSADGRITTTAPASSFDRETQDAYFLTVKASGGGNPPQTGINLH